MSDARFSVRLYCGDCCGNDFLGCFDGSSELQDDTFETAEQAEKFGWEAVRNCGPWEFEVLDPSGEIVFDSVNT